MNGSVLAALGIYTRNMDIHILARFRNIRKHTFAVNGDYAYVRIIRFTRFQVFPLNIYKSCPFGFRQCRYIRTVAAMYRNTSSLCYEADYIVARHRVAAAGYPYHKIVGSLYYYTRIIPYQAVRLFALCIVRFRRLCPLIVFYVIELLLLVIILNRIPAYLESSVLLLLICTYRSSRPLATPISLMARAICDTFAVCWGS